MMECAVGADIGVVGIKVESILRAVQSDNL